MTTAWTNDLSSSARFWNKASRKYAASPIRDQASYEKTLARAVEHLGHEDAVLELGCGTGTTALLLAPNVGSYLATDFADGMIAIAGQKLADEMSRGSAPEGLSFAVADVFSTELVPAGEAYDAVLAFNFLHLVEDQEKTLDRIAQLLKPGGLYISKTVCLKKRAWLFGPLIWILQRLGKAPHVRMLSFETLETMIRDSGFEIVETGTYPAPFSRFVVARKV